jgi:hypothetical protein
MPPPCIPKLGEKQIEFKLIAKMVDVFAEFGQSQKFWPPFPLEGDLRPV